MWFALKYPLDKICVKSGIYCQSCQRKIENGVVGEDDIQVMRALINLEDKLRFLLKKGEFVKSVFIDDEAVVLLRDGFELNELTTLEKELSHVLGRKIKILEYTNDMKKLVEQLIAPASPLGINKIWLPTGEEVLNIRVSRREKKYLLRTKEQYENLIEKISGVKVKIVFE